MKKDTDYYFRKYQILINSNQGNRQLDLLLSFIWNYSIKGEEWQEIGDQGKYFVSNYGRVLSLCCDGYKLLKPFICSGYECVDLRLNNKTIRQKVHRLVAKAFVDNPDNKPIVHHKDHNARNNVAENLVYMTCAEHSKEHSKNKKDKSP